MPKRVMYKPDGPSLQPERAIPALEELIARAPGVKAAGDNSPTRNEWANEAESLLNAALGGDHNLVNNFKRDFHGGVYYPHDSGERLRAQFERQVDGGVAALKAAVKHLRLQLPDPTQVFLAAGSQHDAYTEIRKNLSQAIGEILIVDPWVDHTLWILLTNLAKNVKIRVFTEHMKGDFILEGKKFAAQHGLAVEVRRTTNYHDRFIVIDGNRCFHLGASIKDAGNKASMISEITRPQVIIATIADIEFEWTKASQVF